MIDKEKIDKISKAIVTTESFYDDSAEMLINAIWDNTMQAVKEFAENLKQELTAKCVVVHPINNPCEWDMSRNEVFELIDNLTKLFCDKGKS